MHRAPREHRAWAEVWSTLIGLPLPAARVTVTVIVVTLVVDTTLQAAGIGIYGARGLDGSGNFLGSWDLLKAVATVLALLWVAWTLRSRPFAAFGIVYFLVEAEDQLGLHHAAGARVAKVLVRVMPGSWVAAHSRPVGTFVVMTLFALVGFGLIWVWEGPREAHARRARLVLTGLLVVLYLVAGVLNFLDTVYPSKWWPALEETGERVIMTLSLGYSLGLIWMLKARQRLTTPSEG
jgi:hypothetical protein